MMCSTTGRIVIVPQAAPAGATWRAGRLGASRPRLLAVDAGVERDVAADAVHVARLAVAAVRAMAVAADRELLAVGGTRQAVLLVRDRPALGGRLARGDRAAGAGEAAVLAARELTLVALRRGRRAGDRAGARAFGVRAGH